jgi:hypothetical protein
MPGMSSLLRCRGCWPQLLQALLPLLYLAASTGSVYRSPATQVEPLLPAVASLLLNTILHPMRCQHRVPLGCCCLAPTAVLVGVLVVQVSWLC